MTSFQEQAIRLLKQILGATGGGVGGGVTSVSGTAPIASSGGATPEISIAPATPSDPGSMSAADKTKLDGLTAHSGGVIGTAQVVVVPGTSFSLSHPFGVLASGITPTYNGTGDYTITKSTDFADDGRDFRVGVTVTGGTPFFVTVDNTANTFQIKTFDVAGVLIDAPNLMISVEKLSQ